VGSTDLAWDRFMKQLSTHEYALALSLFYDLVPSTDLHGGHPFGPIRPRVVADIGYGLGDGVGDRGQP